MSDLLVNDIIDAFFALKLDRGEIGDIFSREATHVSVSFVPLRRAGVLSARLKGAALPDALHR